MNENEPTNEAQEPVAQTELVPVEVKSVAESLAELKRLARSVKSWEANNS